ncbi:MAG: hypothetical protein FVQ79_13770 [Planctomycetes bacterium]|nr:hypothetical protein [Planctomycetota bacterium]
MAHYGRDTDADIGLAEIGGCHDFIPEKFRLGLGLGKSFVDQDLSFSCESDLDGTYLISEIIYLFNNSLLASVTGIYGSWDAEKEHQFNKRTILSASINDSCRGEDPDVSGGKRLACGV